MAHSKEETNEWAQHIVKLSKDWHYNSLDTAQQMLKKQSFKKFVKTNSALKKTPSHLWMIPYRKNREDINNLNWKKREREYLLGDLPSSNEIELGLISLFTSVAQRIYTNELTGISEQEKESFEEVTAAIEKLKGFKIHLKNKSISELYTKHFSNLIHLLPIPIPNTLLKNITNSMIGKLPLIGIDFFLKPLEDYLNENRAVQRTLKEEYNFTYLRSVKRTALLLVVDSLDQNFKLNQKPWVLISDFFEVFFTHNPSGPIEGFSDRSLYALYRNIK